MRETKLRSRADALADALVSWRRDFHRHPELGFEERRTARRLGEELAGIGLEVHAGIARTGLVGVLRSERQDRPPVLLRSDMDALPVEEVEGREYGSTVPGKMHACGHDGHMAMLLGAARLLTDLRDRLPGDAVFCFQPAEEGLGGARVMVEEGVLDRFGVGSAYALHLWSGIPAGTLQVRSGPALGASDEFAAVFEGKGGHGAMPHLTRDPVLAAAIGVVGLQQLVARNVDPMEPAVATVGSIQAGHAPNVIPEQATLLGTLRSFHPDVRRTLRTRLKEVLETAARSTGCRLALELKDGFPAVVNDPAAVERLRTCAVRVLGEEAVSEHPRMAISEDFSYFLEAVPGALALLGAGNSNRGITAAHHAPDFDIDETVLPRGTELLAALALETCG